MTQTETRIFHYDQMGHIIAETNQTGQMLAEYVYLGDRLLNMIKPGETAYYFHNDHLGTPQVLTDATQAVVWKAAYTPFGEAVTSIATVENPFRFPGQYYDSETGLHYNYHRYYNPPIGRYITPDPIGLWGGINLFVYVQGNATNRIDPFGLQNPIPIPAQPSTWQAIAAGAAAAWGAIKAGALVTGEAIGSAAVGTAAAVGAIAVGIVLATPSSIARDEDIAEPVPVPVPASRDNDEDRCGKWMCEGYANYEIIGAHKHVIRGDWIVAYGNTEAAAALAWIKAAQASAPRGHTARHIKPRCRKIR